jgi:hypothetical protein
MVPLFMFIYINNERLHNGSSMVKRKIVGFFNVYRVVVAIGFLIAAALCLAIPAHNNEPDDWAYYYAVKNFSQGKLTIGDFLHFQQEMDAGRQGGMLIQYYRIGIDRWILEKPPGYVFFLVPFELMGIPRWGNVLLALGMTIVTYILLKRLKDERAACIGSLLMLFTPASLMMFNRSFADAFAASAFLVMGGGLYIYHYMERAKLRPWSGAALLFLSFLFLGWSVVTRYTDLPIAVIFALHFVITRLRSLWKREETRPRFEIPSVVLGIAVPLASLLWYNVTVFGSPFDNGYNYTLYPVRFAYNYIGQVDPTGQSIFFKIILGNLRNVPWNLFLGYPLLVIGVPGVIFIYYIKTRALVRRPEPAGTWAGLDTELPWDILLVLTGWFISVFGLYMMYEWTSTTQMSGIPNVAMNSLHFIVFARFYLPGLLPIVVIVSLIAARFPVKVWAALLAIAVVAGSIMYVQSALGETLIPRLIQPGHIPPRPGP